MPIRIHARNTTSSKMLTAVEIDRETRGVLLSPMDISAVEDKFISAVTRKPSQIILRYWVVRPRISTGVFSRVRKYSAPAVPTRVTNPPQNTVSTMAPAR